MRRKWFRLVFRQRVFVILMLLLQISLMTFTIYSSSQAYKWIYYILNLLSAFVVLHMISTDKRPSYKLIWSITILLFPLFGGLLYLFVSLQPYAVGFRKPYLEAERRLANYAEQDPKVMQDIHHLAPFYSRQADFLTDKCGFCAYAGDSVEYLSPGEEKLRRMLAILQKAEKFIFLEYFIITEGKMWNAILEILKKKAADGVDVRIIYDDLGCFMKLPLHFQKIMEQSGIRCRVFNKFRPALSTLQNNRDHRKIAVVDGKWAITGGINIGDEYINADSRFGHWKDASVLLSGQAANSFTRMFLTMWQALTGEKEDVASFIQSEAEQNKTDGFVIPYCDNPMDAECVGEEVYMNTIAGAKQYLYIQTPYLIIDDSMVQALILAAKSGVDVRIITPRNPDKWYVHMTTRSYYRDLIRGGVKLYEYTPGFIHSKVMVSDDMVATVGSVNLDFRSLYLHFECGAWLLLCQAVKEIKEDFLTTLRFCTEVRQEDCRVGFIKKVLQNIFRLLAPLM